MTKFSQRHYEAIAEVISHRRLVHLAQGITGQAVWELDNVEEGLIELFRGDNPRFKESIFRKACK